MQKLMRIANNIFLGLVLTLFIAIPQQDVCAQGIPGVKTVTQTATNPLKATQSGIKEVTQPVKDVNRGIQDIARAPKDITNEVKRTGQEIDRSKSEVQRTEESLEKLTGTGDGKDDKNKSAKDSANVKGDPNAVDGTGDATSQRKSAIPEDFVPTNSAAATDEEEEAPKKAPLKKGELPFYSKDNKTPSGPYQKSEMPKNTMASGGVEETGNAKRVDGKAVDGKGVDGKSPSNTKLPQSTEDGDDSERRVNLDPEFRAATRKTRPDYSGSPARIALEKAEFDLETLDELFKHSNWEGPEREHTVRAVGYALDDLQNAIFEIKRIDPAQSTFRFERRYKEMKAAYKAELAQ